MRWRIILLSHTERCWKLELDQLQTQLSFGLSFPVQFYSIENRWHDYQGNTFWCKDPPTAPSERSSIFKYAGPSNYEKINPFILIVDSAGSCRTTKQTNEPPRANVKNVGHLLSHLGQSQLQTIRKSLCQMLAIKALDRQKTQRRACVAVCCNVLNYIALCCLARFCNLHQRAAECWGKAWT